MGYQSHAGMNNKITIILFVVAMLIAFAWDKVTIIKDSAHFLLDPSFGFLINWNNFYGLLIVVFILNVIISLIHKYTTNQEALKDLKEKHKKLQEQMKEAQKSQDQHKIAELSKQSFSGFGEQMKHSFSSLAYTAIPIILFFRWFGDFFESLGNPKIFISFGWFGTYLIFSIIFSIVIRKVLKVN